jgi:hypothetical protein
MEEKISRCDVLRRCVGCAVLVSTCFSIIGCSSTATTPVPRRQTAPAPGFFERWKDEFTGRDCNVGRFVCSYGAGPAGEPCECTDPSRVVLRGRTIRQLAWLAGWAKRLENLSRSIVSIAAARQADLLTHSFR